MFIFLNWEMLLNKKRRSFLPSKTLMLQFLAHKSIPVGGVCLVI